MILVGGDNLIDFIQSGEGLNFTGVEGGSCYNVALAMGRQQAPVSFAAALSSDSLGQALAAKLEASAVQLTGPRPDAPTSLAMVTVEGGQPAYQFYRDGTADRIVDAHGITAQMENAAAFHIGSLALTGGADADAWQQLFSSARTQGLFTSLDPNVRPALVADKAAYIARLEAMFADAALIKLSDEDIAWLWPDQDAEDAFLALAKRFPAPLCVLTKGADGALAVTAGGIRAKVSSAPVPVLKDTVGAGDTFMGTLLAELHRRDCLSPDAAAALTADGLSGLLSIAAQAAALNCGRTGCNPPALSELQAV